MNPGMENQVPRDLPDPGFFGPESLVWILNRERVIYLGGLRAILMQLAHPKIAGAVAQHSDFQQNPLGRFQRTMDAVQDILFGDRHKAIRAAQRVRNRHGTVRGFLQDHEGGLPYDGNDPALLLWVFATLIDSLIYVHTLLLPPLPARTWRRFYLQGLPFAQLFGVPAECLPETLAEFKAYVAREMHSPAVSPTGRFLAEQLLGLPHGIFRPLNTWLAAGTLPPVLRQAYGLSWRSTDQAVFRAVCRSLRLAIRLAPDRLRIIPAARQREKLLGFRVPSLKTSSDPRFSQISYGKYELPGTEFSRLRDQTRNKTRSEKE